MAAEPDAASRPPIVIANLHVMTQPARLDAVLFDMDGTLVDSEKVWQAALTDLAARHGATLSPAGERAVLGATTREAMEILFADIERPDEDQQAAGVWLEERVKALFAREVRLAARAPVNSSRPYAPPVSKRPWSPRPDGRSPRSCSTRWAATTST